MSTPTIYRRSTDSRWICVVRSASGKALHRGTGHIHESCANEFARLLQREIQRQAELGNILPPAPKRTYKKRTHEQRGEMGDTVSDSPEK